MKKYFLLIIAITLSVTGFTQGIDFEKLSLDEAFTKAKSQNKHVFIDVFTDWCGPCKNLAANVFPDPRLGSVFNEKFINIKIDAEKGEGPAFAKKNNVKAFPTLLFLDADGEVIRTVVGGRSVEDFITIANGLNAFKKLGDNSVDRDAQQKYMDSQYRNGESTPEFLLKYYKIADTKTRAEVVNKYLNSLSDYQLLKVENAELNEIYTYDYTLMNRIITGLAKINNGDKTFNSTITFPIQYKLSTFLQQSIDTNNSKMFVQLMEMKKQASGLHQAVDKDINLTTGRGLFFVSDELVNLIYNVKNPENNEKVKADIVTYMDRFMSENTAESIQEMIDGNTLLGKHLNGSSFDENIDICNHIIKWTEYYWKKSEADKKVLNRCATWCQYAASINPYSAQIAITSSALLKKMNCTKEFKGILKRAIQLQEPILGTDNNMIIVLKDLLSSK